MKPDTRNGFSMLELLIASAVLLVAVSGLLAFYRTPLILNEIAEDTTIAVQDASQVIEAIHATPFGSIQSTDWDTWAQNNGAKNLPSETLSITYSGTDPLTFTVAVQWTRRGATRTIALTSRVSNPAEIAG